MSCHEVSVTDTRGSQAVALLIRPTFVTRQRRRSREEKRNKSQPTPRVVAGVRLLLCNFPKVGIGFYMKQWRKQEALTDYRLCFPQKETINNVFFCERKQISF